MSDHTDPALTHICANRLDSTMPDTTPGLVVDMPMDSCAFCRAGVCVQSLADDVVLHMRVGPVPPEKPVDHAHAITQLRWLIKHDFEERHGETTIHRVGGGTKTSVVSKHWWDHGIRQMDIARLRSYIGAVRVLEGRA